ncbi:hypothetical protein ACU686_23615 [Yinghuangia aomiensis]
MEDPESGPDHRAAPSAALPEPPERPRTGRAAPSRAGRRTHLARAAHADAEIRAAVRAVLDAVRTATAHLDGTTTLVVATAAWTRLRDTAAN